MKGFCHAERLFHTVTTNWHSSFEASGANSPSLQCLILDEVKELSVGFRHCVTEVIGLRGYRSEARPNNVFGTVNSIRCKNEPFNEFGHICCVRKFGLGETETNKCIR